MKSKEVKNNNDILIETYHTKEQALKNLKTIQNSTRIEKLRSTYPNRVILLESKDNYYHLIARIK